MKYIVIESYRRFIQWLVGFGLFEFPVLHAIRVILMRSAFRIGKGARIGSHVHLTRQHHMVNGSLEVGKNVTLANQCDIDFSGTVSIADNATISAGVTIISHTHSLMAMADGNHDATAGSVHIGYGVWIGTKAIILPNVNIGKYAVVGAGAVVTHDVPEYAVVAGNPARKIKDVRDE